MPMGRYTVQRKTTGATISESSVCFIAGEQMLVQWQPERCDWLSHYLGLDSEHSSHQDLCVGGAHGRRCAECRLLICRPTTTYARYLRTPCSDFWDAQEYGVPRLLFRSTECQVGWLPGRASIFSYKSSLYPQVSVVVTPSSKNLLFVIMGDSHRDPQLLKMQRRRDC